MSWTSALARLRRLIPGSVRGSARPPRLPPIRPSSLNLEALEDRLLLSSFQWGVGRTPDVVQSPSDQAAPLIHLRRVVGDTVAAPANPTESITVKINPLQTMDGGTTALSGNVTQKGREIAAMVSSGWDIGAGRSPGQTSLQAPDGGTTVVTAAVGTFIKI
jgi:hypothetical protein